MKNKHAEVPVMILVLGVVAICGLAVLSFIVSDKIAKSDKLDLGVFEQVNADVEKFEFYRNVGYSNDEAANRIDSQIDSGNLIIERSNDLFSIKYEYDYQSNP